MKYWINGQLVEDDRASVSVLDHGFTVGDGVFETAKVVAGAPFALSRHLKRLSESAARLGLPAPDLEQVRTGVHQVLGANTADIAPVARLRITYTGGPGPLGSDRGTGAPTLVIALSAARPWAPSAAVVTVPWPRNERGAVAGIKTTSYAENIVALAYAKQRAAGEAIFGNTVGNLCEGTGSNVVIVIDGQAITPPLSSGCLAGVTRGLLVEWCGVVERDLSLDALRTADEIFLASSTRDVQPVHQVDDRAVEAPGPTTARIAAEFATRSAGDVDP